MTAKDQGREAAAGGGVMAKPKPNNMDVATVTRHVKTVIDPVVRPGRAEKRVDSRKPLPTGAELQAYWLARLPQGERALLEQLIPAYPEAVDREALTEATGYQRSTRDAYLQRMRAKQLVEEPGRGMVRASANLF